MDKKFYEEVLKTAILAFESNGYANFSVKELAKCSIGEKKIQSILRDLEDQKLIENNTVNGYYSRYKLNYSGTCPDYLFDDRFPFGIKSFILRTSKVWNADNPKLTGKNLCNLLEDNSLDRGSSNMASRNMSKIKSITNGETVYDIITNSYDIRINLADNEDIVLDNNGCKLVRAKSSKDYKCQYCGETDLNNFYSSHITCKKCHNEIQRSNKRKDTFKFLYSKARDGYDIRPNIKGFTITIEDLKAQWEKQDCRDYYTGLEVEDLLKLSVDRIDSNKGYTPDNIVLTDYRINIMKNDLSVEEFKDLISKIYANISNF